MHSFSFDSFSSFSCLPPNKSIEKTFNVGQLFFTLKAINQTWLIKWRQPSIISCVTPTGLKWNQMGWYMATKYIWICAVNVCVFLFAQNYRRASQRTLNQSPSRSEEGLSRSVHKGRNVLGWIISGYPYCWSLVLWANAIRVPSTFKLLFPSYCRRDWQLQRM